MQTQGTGNLNQKLKEQRWEVKGHSSSSSGKPHQDPTFKIKQEVRWKKHSQEEHKGCVKKKHKTRIYDGKKNPRISVSQHRADA